MGSQELGESKNSGSFETQGDPQSNRSALYSGFTLAGICLALAVAFRSVLGFRLVALATPQEIRGF
jgi:hypothetical protein